MKDKFRNILHLYSSFTSGGAEKVMVSLAKGLDDRGLRNYVGAPKNSFMYLKAKDLKIAALPVFIKGSLDVLGIARLIYICYKYDIQIIHAHQGKVFWPCVFSKGLRFGKTKIVFHRHADLGHKFYSRLHYWWADKVIAISSAVARGLEKKEYVPCKKITVVYNGTDFARFSPQVPDNEIRNKYNLGSDVVIGTVGAMNLPKGKGQEYLIDAAIKLNDSFPKLKYLIVGKGPFETYLKNKVNTSPVRDKVLFAGHQEDVEKYIAAMDIFCLLSWDTEGFGQVLIEAQGMGKPVIGTSIGGIPETLIENVTGFVIPPENVDALCEKIKYLAESDQRRKEMGKTALRFAKERFAMDVMVSSVLSIYKSMYTN